MMRKIVGIMMVAAFLTVNAGCVLKQHTPPGQIKKQSAPGQEKKRR